MSPLSHRDRRPWTNSINTVRKRCTCKTWVLLTDASAYQPLSTRELTLTLTIILLTLAQNPNLITFCTESTPFRRVNKRKQMMSNIKEVTNFLYFERW